MNIAVIHGSPRRGNTYTAANIFLNELKKCGDVLFKEFYLPGSMPEFCLGCQACFGGPSERCPHAEYVAPIADALTECDAMIITSPHYGVSGVPGCLQNLLDHLEFLSMNISPRAEMFSKKAFVITTGAGSARALKIIKRCLIRWGVNRVYAVGIRMRTNNWDHMPDKLKRRTTKRLRISARTFYAARRKRPHPSAVFMYHVYKYILKKYIGAGAYPYEYWNERGYFKKRPF